MIKSLAACAVRFNTVSPATYLLERWAASSSLMHCCICSDVNVAESNDPRRFEFRWMLTILSLETPNTPVLGVDGDLFPLTNRPSAKVNVSFSGLTLLSNIPGSESWSLRPRVPPLFSSSEEDSWGASLSFLRIRWATPRACFSFSFSA